MTVSNSPGSTSPVRAPGVRRLTQLDGLRGIAALVVVVHHSLLVSPWLAAYYAGGALPGAPTWSGVLGTTPLHLLWDGDAAVWLFFVLSGFVLGVQYLDSPRFFWLAYYPRRMLRLYLPVWGAVAFTVLAIVIVPREESPTLSWWVTGHDRSLTPLAVVQDLTLLRGSSGLNTPLWSLQWEILFSLLLPVFIVIAVMLRRAWWLVMVMLVAVQHLGSSGYTYFLPIFAVGVVLSARRDLMDRVATAMPTWGWPATLVLALGLTAARWFPAEVPASGKLMLVGVSLLIFVFYGWSGAKAVGDHPATQWLGKRSFSIYLIHEPIVVSVAYLFHTANPLLTLALTLPLSFLMGELFFRIVESPAHRASQGVDRTISRRYPGRPKVALHK